MQVSLHGSPGPRPRRSPSHRSGHRCGSSCDRRIVPVRSPRTTSLRLGPRAKAAVMTTSQARVVTNGSGVGEAMPTSTQASATSKITRTTTAKASRTPMRPSCPESRLTATLTATAERSGGEAGSTRTETPAHVHRHTLRTVRRRAYKREITSAQDRAASTYRQVASPSMLWSRA
jgi:hypothetical protein